MERALARMGRLNAQFAKWHICFRQEGRGTFDGTTPSTEFSIALKARFDGLSPQLQEAARWVIDHPADVALLTMREQARRCGVAPATLTRLAQHLGLSGYDDVRRVHAEAVRAVPRASMAAPRNCWRATAATAMPAWRRTSSRPSSGTSRPLATPDAIERIAAAAEMIAVADHVFCLGQRSSFSVAFIFHYVRSLFGSKSVLLDGWGATGRDSLRAVGPKDALLAITVDPYVRDTVETARYAKSRGARVVAISDSELSPLAAVADRTIVIRTETPSFFHTMTPALAAAECLAALVAARRGKETLSALAASEQQLAAFGTYVAKKKSKRVRS